MATLVAPCDVSAFMDVYWGRKPMLENRHLPDFYDGLLTIEDIDRVLADISRGGVPRKTSEIDIDAALRRMEQGAALVLQDAQQQIANLALACRVLHAETGFRSSATLEVTLPGNKPRPAEPMESHVFVLQLQGRRHWLIEEQAAPVGPRGDHDAPGEFILDTGDLLYLPPGVPVQHRTTGDKSVIAMLVLAAPRWVDMTGNRALANDPTLPEPLAAPLPPGWLRQKREALVGELSRRWRQADDMITIEAAVDQMIGAEVRAFPVDMRGRLKAVLEPREIRPDTIFGARRDLLWAIERNGSVNRLIAGPLTLDMADNMCAATEYCLTERRYSLQDLPGELSAAERLTLVDRLCRTRLIDRRSG